MKGFQKEKLLDCELEHLDGALVLEHKIKRRGGGLRLKQG